jgi:hypothetical protein
MKKNVNLIILYLLSAVLLLSSFTCCCKANFEMDITSGSFVVVSRPMICRLDISFDFSIFPWSMITDNRIFSRNFAVYGRLR